MLPTPPLYLPTPTLIPPPNYTTILGGRSRDRHILGVSHKLWTIRIVYHQKYCNNAIDRNRLFAPTSLQRWASLLRRSRRQFQTLVHVPVPTSRGSGESRTWSTRSRASGDHKLSPFNTSSPLPSTTSSSHFITCISARSKEWQFITLSLLRFFSLHVSIPSVCFHSLCVPSLLFLSLRSPVVCVLIIGISANGCLPLSRCFTCVSLYIISVCMQLILLYNPPSPLLSSRWVYNYIKSSRPHQVRACMYHHRKPPFLVWTGDFSLLSLVIYFVSRSLFCTRPQLSLTVTVLFVALV